MTSSDLSLSVSRVIPASRERVFRAWVDPQRLMEWWGPENVKCVSAEVKLEIGGPYRITLQGEKGIPFAVTGIYREIVEPERLVFTWDWDDDDMRMGVETEVSVDFKDLNGKTEVTITHAKFPAEGARDGHEGGWTNLLDKLEAIFNKQ